MSVRYDGLFALLQEKQIAKTKLCADIGMSSATLAKFAKNEYVSMSVINRICNYLSCTPNDVLSFEPDQEVSDLLKRLLDEKQARIKGGIYHQTQITMTYNSNHIEGSRLTEDQTRYIFETNTIGVNGASAIDVDDVIETTNHFRCIDYVLEHVFDLLNESFIKELHRMLKTGTKESRLDWFAVGEYKKKPNVVGGEATAAPAEVADCIQSLTGRYENKGKITFEDIIDFQYEFEKIHPFQDGNGRVGRLIAFKECLRFGVVPFIIDDSIKLFYYRGLKEWTKQRGYLLDTCLTGQDKYKKILDYYQISVSE